MIFLGFGKSKLKIEGLIGYYALGNWWISTFSDAEREYMEQKFQPMGLVRGSRSLTCGKIASNSQPCAEFLNGLATWFHQSEDRSIADRVRQKIVELGKTEPIRGPGYYRGRHFTTYVEEVKELKRTGDFKVAEKLLLDLIEATEAEAKARKWGVAPWYYEQLAIIYRKHKDYRAEVKILERFAKQKHAPGTKPTELMARLKKAKQSDNNP